MTHLARAQARKHVCRTSQVLRRPSATNVIVREAKSIFTLSSISRVSNRLTRVSTFVALGDLSA